MQQVGSLLDSGSGSDGSAPIEVHAERGGAPAGRAELLEAPAGRSADLRAAKRARREASPAPFAAYSHGSAIAASASSSGSSSSSGGAVTAAAAAPPWSPIILVKVGTSGSWGVFDCDDDVLAMHRTKLLKALRRDEVYGGYFKDAVALGECAVRLLKGSLPAGQKLPTNAAEVIASNSVELEANTLVSDAAKEGKCSGGRLFILVQLPAAAASSAVFSAPAPGSTAAKLHAALMYAKLEAIEGEPPGGCELLSLYDSTGKRVKWPHLRSNKLFVRPVYREFFERPDMFNCGKARKASYGVVHTLVCGIPGIGKSSFALYCLWRLVVLEKRHVLYDYPKGMEMHVTLEFGSGDRSSAVYIADGLVPRRDAGIQLLVTSPRQKAFKEFQKDALSFYMPEPTLNEVFHLRDLCFAGITDDILDSRMAFWGRPLCMLFTAAAFEEDQREATNASLREEPLRRLLDTNLEDVGSGADVSFRVVHYKFGFDTAAPYTWTAGQETSRNYRKVSMRWASESMEDLVGAFLSDAEHRSRLR